MSLTPSSSHTTCFRVNSMKKSMIAATHNRAKFAELKRIVERGGIELCMPDDPMLLGSVEENGETFSENALIKARAVFWATGYPCIADDSGLCIDALGGDPGVHSARFMGEDTPYTQKNARILELLADVPDGRRTARFVSAIAVVTPRCERVFTGVCEGIIGRTPKGENGFGYDPIFYVGEESFASMSPEQKDSLSHRARALRELAARIDEIEF